MAKSDIPFYSTEDAPLVSIIIVNWNGKKWLEECYTSIFKQTYKNIEAILVDNNSQDDSTSYTQTKWPQVKIVQLDKNYAYAGGNNRGAENSKGEYLFFLNNDTKLFPDCIEKLIKHKNEGEVIAPKQLVGDFNNPNKAIMLGNGADIFGYPFGVPDFTKQKVFYADGAALFILSEVFKILGGFDEKLFMFQDDIDLSWKARLAGYKIIKCPEAQLYHFSGGSAPGGSSAKKEKYTLSEFRRFHNEKNIIRNILKNYSWIFALPLLAVLLVIQLLEIMALVLLGGYKIALCYPKAYWWNLLNIRDTLRARIFIQSKRKINDFDILKNMYLSYSKLTALYRLGKPAIS